MTKSEQSQLIALLNPRDVKDKIAARVRALEWVENQKPVENVKSPRTDSQHRAWFLWLGMIEKLAENEGITWNQVVGQTHQLKITTEGLHVMGKQLQKALWGTDSTKQLKKIGQIDILIDHFVDLFSKVGLELPPFPSNDEKESTLKNMELAKTMNYPEYNGTPTI
jgi:hypothetical protein